MRWLLLRWGPTLAVGFILMAAGFILRAQNRREAQGWPSGDPHPDPTSRTRAGAS